jgi:hypothetical protein
VPIARKKSQASAQSQVSRFIAQSVPAGGLAKDFTMLSANGALIVKKHSQTSAQSPVSQFIAQAVQISGQTKIS